MEVDFKDKRKKNVEVIMVAKKQTDTRLSNPAQDLAQPARRLSPSLSVSAKQLVELLPPIDRK